MNVTEEVAWSAYTDVIKKFLGTEIDPNHEQIVDRVLSAFQVLGCNMSLKLHFYYINYFPENLRSYPEEQGEKVSPGHKKYLAALGM